MEIRLGLENFRISSKYVYLSDGEVYLTVSFLSNRTLNLKLGENAWAMAAPKNGTQPGEL